MWDSSPLEAAEPLPAPALGQVSAKTRAEFAPVRRAARILPHPHPIILHVSPTQPRTTTKDLQEPTPHTLHSHTPLMPHVILILMPKRRTHAPRATTAHEPTEQHAPNHASRNLQLAIKKLRKACRNQRKHKRSARSANHQPVRALRGRARMRTLRRKRSRTRAKHARKPNLEAMGFSKPVAKTEEGGWGV